jgi:RNA polymerase sigma factor for flagellar operon FliA
MPSAVKIHRLNRLSGYVGEPYGSLVRRCLGTDFICHCDCTQHDRRRSCRLGDHGGLHGHDHCTQRRKDAKDEIQEVWRRYKSDLSQKELRNRLVERYLPLVKYNGERIWARLPEGVELDDLISAGVFGLMDAIDAFDLSRGVKFETYCVPRIRGAMLDELRTMDWVPDSCAPKPANSAEATKTLEAKFGRQPTERELVGAHGPERPELEKMMLDANAVNLISLNKKWYETDSYKDVREIDISKTKRGKTPRVASTKTT